MKFLPIILLAALSAAFIKALAKVAIHDESALVALLVVLGVGILGLVFLIYRRFGSPVTAYVLSTLGVTEKKGSVKKVICRNCGVMGNPLRVRKGAGVGKFFEAVFWLILVSPLGWFLSIFGFFLVPLGFTAWRNAYRYSVCKMCEGRDVIPLDSPAGKDLRRRFDNAK